MEVKLQKWGNSEGLRIPNSILKELNWKSGDTLKLINEGGKLMLEKKEKKYMTLEERFQNYNGENLCKEFEWDEPQGKEIW